MFLYVFKDGPHARETINGGLPPDVWHFPRPCDLSILSAYDREPSFLTMETDDYELTGLFDGIATYEWIQTGKPAPTQRREKIVQAVIEESEWFDETRDCSCSDGWGWCWSLEAKELW